MTAAWVYLQFTFQVIGGLETYGLFWQETGADEAKMRGRVTKAWGDAPLQLYPIPIGSPQRVVYERVRYYLP